jgi:phosphomannomutase
MEVKDPDAVLEKVRDSFSGGRGLDIDGVFIKFDDWWLSLRKSNTEPVVRLRIEADSKKKLDEMKKKLVSMIKE